MSVDITQDLADALLPAEEKQVAVASPGQIMRWRFAQHKLAVVSLGILLLFYFVAGFAEFFAPFNPFDFSAQDVLAPPQRVRIVDSEGNFQRPFVYGYTRARDPETLRRIYVDDPTQIYTIYFFVRGTPLSNVGLHQIRYSFFRAGRGL